MTDFDPIKAMREELAGLVGVEGAIRERERECEEQMSKAERELNAVRKLRGFARMQMQQLRDAITRLEQAPPGGR